MTGQIDWVELFFSSTGRVARMPFLIAAAVLFALLTLYQAVAGPTLTWLTGWFVYPVLLFCGSCVLSKRLHDRGRSGWWALVILMAVIAVWPAPGGFFDFLFALVVIWAAVELGALPGEQGANRYGPNPIKAGWAT